jgi:hypothetical protein
MLHSALHLDIHAPVSDIQCILGLLFTGGATWGPYALDVTYLCLAIYALSIALPSEDSIVFGASVLLLLVQPITFRALAVVKSDWDGGILLAAALLILFESAEKNDNRMRALGAALLGLMPLTKMTAFYLPLLALGVFLIFEFYGALSATIATNPTTPLSLALSDATRNTFGMRVRQRAMCVALIIVPYVLFFYQAHKALLPYIEDALGPIWADGFTIYQRVLFYSPFQYGGARWGSLHLMFLTFFVAALVASIAKRALLHVFACAGVVLIAAIFLMPLAVAHTSNITFAAPFFGAVMGGTLILLRIFLVNSSRWATLSAPIVVLALALPSGMPIGPLDSRGDLKARLELEHYQSVFEDMAGAIAQRTTAIKPEVVFTFDHQFMPYPNLGIRYFQRTGHLLSIDSIDDLNGRDTASLLADADFVITITPNTEAHTVPFLASNMPISADPSLADARVRESGRYGPVANYQVSGAEVWLYQAGMPH